MSSTNRSKARDNHVSDYYVTLIADIELFLHEFDKRIHIDWNAIKIVNCCAGGNDEIRDEHGIKKLYNFMSYLETIYNVFGNCNVNTIEIRSNSLATIKYDYLLINKKKYQPNPIIINPSFSITVDVIKRQLVKIKTDM